MLHEIRELLIARKRDTLDAKVQSLLTSTESLLSRDDIADIRSEVGEEWKRGEQEFKQLAGKSADEAADHLDRLEHETDTFWHGLGVAITDARAELMFVASRAADRDALAVLEAKVETTIRRRSEEQLRATEAAARSSKHRFIAQFEGDEHDLRRAVGAYMAGAEARERLWYGTVATLKGVLAGPAPDERPRRRGADVALGAAVDLADQIDDHLREVKEGREPERLLSVSTEREIRSLLVEYICAVKVSRRRDMANAFVPAAACFVVGVAVALAGRTESFRGSDLFASLAQILPLLLLALSVEVRFLAERGAARFLTAVTLLLVSLGFAACVYVLVSDQPSRLAAGGAVGAAAAGVAGLIVATLWRATDPRDLFDPRR